MAETMNQKADKLQSINLDIDRDLWREVGIIAAEKSLFKRQVVEAALIEYMRKESKRNE